MPQSTTATGALRPTLTEAWEEVVAVMIRPLSREAAQLDLALTSPGAQRDLADRWGWSRGAVRRFIEKVEAQDRPTNRPRPATANADNRPATGPGPAQAGPRTGPPPVVATPTIAAQPARGPAHPEAVAVQIDPQPAHEPARPDLTAPEFSPTDRPTDRPTVDAHGSPIVCSVVDEDPEAQTDHEALCATWAGLGLTSTAARALARAGAADLPALGAWTRAEVQAWPGLGPASLRALDQLLEAAGGAWKAEPPKVLRPEWPTAKAVTDRWAAAWRAVYGPDARYVFDLIANGRDYQTALEIAALGSVRAPDDGERLDRLAAAMELYLRRHKAGTAWPQGDAATLFTARRVLPRALTFLATQGAVPTATPPEVVERATALWHDTLRRGMGPVRQGLAGTELAAYRAAVQACGGARAIEDHGSDRIRGPRLAEAFAAAMATALQVGQ